MAWGTKTQIITAQSVAGTEVFSSWVELAPGELAVVQVKADFPVTPTDNLVVRIYGTLDATTEVSDNQAAAALTLMNTSDPAYRSFPISGYRKFRLGVVRSGTTDTITVDAWAMKDGVDLGAE
jgi:hypothetical protein